MNNQTLKSLTNAHAWIGLIISTVLFVVFFAGAITLFKDNITSWERTPLLVDAAHNTQQPAFDKALATIEKNYQVDMHGGMFIYAPDQHNPFIEARFESELAQPDPITGEDHLHQALLLDAITGEIVASSDTHNYAHFLYKMHYDLGLGRAGLYFVGLVTLFFFVAILSGIVIHWRKLFSKFFQYRKEGNKDKWLDAHNLIGTMGLPMHLMYAFTGLVFNLVIIYQISYAVILYQGNQEALLDAAGFDQPHLEEADKRMAMTGVDDMYRRAMATLGDVTIERISIEHFGDENAILVFATTSNEDFSLWREVRYLMSTQEQIYLTMDNYDNAVRGGLSTIASLHFGDFAGYGMRLAFFLFGLATAYVIITGNLMWIAKRAKQRNQSQRSLNFVRRLTSGSFIGVVAATAAGFALARALPVEYLGRAEFIERSFYLIWIVSIVVSQLMRNQKLFCQALLSASAALFALTAISDWTLFYSTSSLLSGAALRDVLLVDTMLLLLAAICIAATKRVYAQETKAQRVSSQPLASEA
ncbi:PepSY-associated TM helix domain-containing protein [Pseudoalteromonas viridis]|uniref:PepSY domain-containing protein n=1 Tax=Pseudoalteromonas viridis TaxID=339617 RepID=A0ABX7VA71_9GAMM|nr:PepSY-associated TM helix domain-containing protein [Pseudoalteromonas viridis]QTL37829.1 PepSY domain-containing protein [Pseudoalteromonas viridis]